MEPFWMILHATGLSKDRPGTAGEAKTKGKQRFSEAPGGDDPLRRACDCASRDPPRGGVRGGT